MAGKLHARDMTQGVIWKEILMFSLPLMLGNLFQQFYNTVDCIVVGNFVGKEALAAVGATSSIINTLVGFFMGMATGAGVVISQYFGAKDEPHLQKAVHTTVSLTLLMGVGFTALSMVLTVPLLRFMKTPADVFGEAKTYLIIYFAGMLGLMLYNMGSGILRAVGDSRRPLYFLILCSILNVVLDLLFVAVFRMGVAGAAYATILAQFISAGLIWYILWRSKECYRFRPKEIALDRDITRFIFRVGLPAGLQQAVTAFSNVFVQSYINAFGSASMAGWSSYARIDPFVLLPMQSISLACTTFVGQNVGAGQLKRSEKGTRQSMYLSWGLTVVLSALLYIFCRPIISVFNRDPDVVYYGTLFIRLMSPFYVLCCVNQIYAGALRGAGDAKAPMFMMLGSFVVFRQIYLYVGTKFIHGIEFVALGYPVGWLLCSILMYIYYRRGNWRMKCQFITPQTVQAGETAGAAGPEEE
ncbi:MAG: MATE family efflux transporter [Clostridiaceae bacterium]|nr:MATE family efflux transporter [Clostridiaceae bacterium]